MELHRLVVVSRLNIDLLPIDSTKPTPTIRHWKPQIHPTVKISPKYNITTIGILACYKRYLLCSFGEGAGPRQTYISQCSAVNDCWLAEVSKSDRLQPTMNMG
eukprot:scaffold6842_cov95-Skeletonema_marinoi.AAC.1